MAIEHTPPRASASQITTFVLHVAGTTQQASTDDQLKNLVERLVDSQKNDAPSYKLSDKDLELVNSDVNRNRLATYLRLADPAKTKAILMLLTLLATGTNYVLSEAGETPELPETPTTPVRYELN